MFLLDTNACIAILNNSAPSVGRQLKQYSAEDIAMSSIVKAELLYGARRSQRFAENLELLQTFFAPYVSIPFDDACADHYGRIRADLAAEGTPIGPNDLLIAACARAYDLTLVTHNTREFGRVSGLRMVDWQEVAADDPATT